MTMAWDQALLWLAGICGAMVTIGGLASKLGSPVKQLKSRLDALEKQVAENSAKLTADMESLKKQEAVNRLTLESLMLLLEHEATGNHNDQLETQAHKLKIFVYDKGSQLK